MSFFLSNNNLNSQQFNYKEIGEEFCKYYFNMVSYYDVNHLYHPQAFITFLEEEFIGVNAYNEKLLSIGSPKFVFNNLNGTIQPLGQNIIISINYYNNILNNNWNKFTNTFILTQLNNNWIIINQIFKIM
jgi:hypothetical protein